MSRLDLARSGVVTTALLALACLVASVSATLAGNRELALGMAFASAWNLAFCGLLAWRVRQLS